MPNTEAEISATGEPATLPLPLAPVPALAVRSHGATHTGRVRESNEDHFLVADLTKTMHVQQTSLDQPSARFSDQRAHLFLVADGMGGHSAGEQASAMAVAVIERFALDTFKWFFHLDGEGTDIVTRQFSHAVEEADALIVEQSAGHRDLEGMGTTLTLAYTFGEELFILHVGDSRAYLFRDAQLRQLTTDHTLVADMVRLGQLSPEQAARHRLRHVITNVLGGREAGVRVDAHTVPLRAGDLLLLCSDGLTEMLPHEAIARVVAEEAEPEAACARLIEAANLAGGRDNVTVIVAQFVAPL